VYHPCTHTAPTSPPKQNICNIAHPGALDAKKPHRYRHLKNGKMLAHSDDCCGKSRESNRPTENTSVLHPQCDPVSIHRSNTVMSFGSGLREYICLKKYLLDLKQ
jgi:hypothetical protein